MPKTHYAPDWQRHLMGPSSGRGPFFAFESAAEEEQAIDDALNFLVSEKILPAAKYDLQKYAKFEEHVRASLEIPWTGISPRMRRLIYAINAILKPRNVVAAGVYCGYTLVCNIGAAVGRGSVYDADNLTGIEILEMEAERARRNLSRFAPELTGPIVCADAVEWLNRSGHNIDLLYIDAKAIEFDATKPETHVLYEKSEYYRIIEAARSSLNEGATILAHNSQNAADVVDDYLTYVRSSDFRNSVNLVVDDAGLEVTVL